jgi:acyl carrier protein phosphodiesterase
MENEIIAIWFQFCWYLALERNWQYFNNNITLASHASAVHSTRSITSDLPTGQHHINEHLISEKQNREFELANQTN